MSTMAIDPKDLWAVLPATLQRQIVDEVATVLHNREKSHENSSSYHG